jgi:ATP-dependent DNA helicase DinG
VLPNYLPDPNSPRFTDATAEMILEVFTETRGRGLALFTSYAMMRKAAAVLRPRLAALGIPMYVQGQDGSRQVLLEQFGREVNSVLLGTSSFWEGIDVKGDALSALVVVKIPFDVPTDPIVKARCDRIQAEGGVPFMEYSVPMAVLRLRQGFGRLIRSTTDRGIVVVADNRLLKSRYGKVFLRSLPTRHRIAYDEQGLRGLVGQFMNAPAGPPKPVSVGRLMRGSEV